VSELEQRHHEHRAVDPMFDGHLEKRVSEMTDAERLQWAWEGAQLLHWARQVRQASGKAGRENADREDSSQP
jgi:hypothetical protein